MTERFTLTNPKNTFQEMKCGIDDKGNTLNKNRVSAYDWFSGEQQATDPRVQQALDAGYSMDEINAFLGR